MMNTLTSSTESKTECSPDYIEIAKRIVQAAGKVVSNPNIRCGLPVIKGTRIGVYEAAGIVKHDGLENAMKSFPSLTKEDLEDAVLFITLVTVSEKSIFNPILKPKGSH